MTNDQYLLVRRDGEVFRFGDQGVTLGRNRANDIVIPGRSVSRFHARILVAVGKCWIRDENSAEGTYVNEQRVQGQQEIKPGDILRVGNMNFRLSVTQEQTKAVADPRPNQAFIIGAAVLIAIFIFVIFGSSGGFPRSTPNSYQAGYDSSSQTTKEVAVEASTSDSVELTLDNGPSVEITAGGLYQDATISLRYVDPPEEADESTYEIIGQTFEFDLSDEDVFSDLVEMTIPYDPNLIPPDTPEANLFAVHLFNGKWVRMRGEVDEENNVIIVHTLHNGFWSWAFDKAADLRNDIRAYLGEVSQHALSIEEAEREVARREQEFKVAWDRMIASAEKYEKDLDPREFASRSITNWIVLEGSKAIIGGIAGKGAILTIGGHQVAVAGHHILIGAEAGLYLGTLMGDTILEIRAVAIAIDKLARLKEAEAVLEALKHPEQKSFYPGDSVFIVDWVNTQNTCQDESGDESIVWECSAVSVDVPESPTPTLPATATSTKKPPTPTSQPPTNTPKPQPTKTPSPTKTLKPSAPTFHLSMDARCREGNSRDFEDVWFFNKGTVLKIIGTDRNGWYKIEFYDSGTNDTSCWIGAGTGYVQGDESSIPYVEPPPQPSQRLPIYDGWTWDSNTAHWKQIGTISCSEVNNYHWTEDPFCMESGYAFVCGSCTQVNINEGCHDLQCDCTLFGSNYAFYTRRDANRICNMNIP